MTTWRAIPGFVGYEVSDDGQVRSYRNNRWGVGTTPRALSLRDIRKTRWSTYKAVRLQDAEGKTVTRKVHTLMLLAFEGPADGRVTRHLNGVASDNRLENLRYGTQTENGLDDVAHGKNRWANRTHCNQGHPLSGDNVRPRSDNPRARKCRECERIRDRKRRSAA